MNIVLLYADKFPVAGAGANRHITIGKGLISQGNKYNVILLRPTENPDQITNKDVTGSVEGIYYEFAPGTVVWPRGKFNKLSLYVKGYLKSFFILERLNKEEKIDVIVSGFSFYLMNLTFKFYSRIRKIKYIYNIDEFPWMLIRPENYSRLYSKLFIKHFYKLFDALVVISTPLKDYYKDKINKSAKIFHLPMSVDPDRFESCDNIKSDELIDLVYCGDYGFNKDGVPILVKAFANVCSKYPNLRLKIVGSTSDSTAKPTLLKIIEENGIQEKVIFAGEVHRDKIPQILCSADILVLSRPNNVQAQGGFPTKLGEYLITGKPVIVTKVGEIPEYLKDRKNAFLAEPDSVESFAQKLAEAIENKELAAEVGANGKQLAMNTFNYKVQAKKFSEFLKELING